MRIDRPTCGLKTCRHYFDGNCLDKTAYNKCDYALLKRYNALIDEIFAMHWIDNADSYICPVCGLETDNPNRYDSAKCPVCGFQDIKDKVKV